MSSLRESQEGLLELEEHLYPTKPPHYDENEPVITLDVLYRFWTNSGSLNKNARFAFSPNMTLEDAMDLAVEKISDTNTWTEKFAFCSPPDERPVLPDRHSALVPLPDTLTILKHIIQNGDKLVISNVADFPERDKQANHKREMKLLSIVLGVIGVLMIGLIGIVVMTLD